MFVLNIIDSKEIKKALRHLFIGHHAEYDFSDSEDDFCELIELTKADTIIIQSNYESVKGLYIINHVLKTCNLPTIKKIVVLYDNKSDIPYDFKIKPTFECVYQPADEINETLLEKLTSEPTPTTVEETVVKYETKKILYVSDDRFMQIVISDLIHNRTSYEIETANNGSQGIKKYHSYKPDLIITDLVMPDIDGLELCEQVKITDHDDKTSVIIFSSTSDEAVIEKAYSLKAKAYIVKPIDPNKFLRKINRILN